MSILKEARAEVGALLGEVLSQRSEEQPSESAEANAGVYMALRAFTDIFLARLKGQVSLEEMVNILEETDAFIEETSRATSEAFPPASA